MATAAEQEAKKIVGKRARQEIAAFVDENIKQLVARLWGLLIEKHQVEHVKTLEEILAESHEQE